MIKNILIFIVGVVTGVGLYAIWDIIPFLWWLIKNGHLEIMCVNGLYGIGWVVKIYL